MPTVRITLTIQLYKHNIINGIHRRNCREEMLGGGEGAKYLKNQNEF